MKSRFKRSGFFIYCNYGSKLTVQTLSNAFFLPFQNSPLIINRIDDPVIFGETTFMKSPFFTVSLVLTLTYSCTSDSEQKGETSGNRQQTIENVSDNDKEEEEAIEAAPKSVQLKGKFLKEDEYGNSQYAVLLTVDGKTKAVDTVLACEPIPASNFGQYNIPKTAKSACGGWWAGAGDYFYATIEKNKVVVYQGWQDEQQEDEGYHWKAMQLK